MYWPDGLSPYTEYTEPCPVPHRLRFRTLLLTLAVPLIAAAQPGPVASGYRKLQVRIPMRDGATLFTNIYVPRDTTRRYPFLMQRTPYSVAPYGPDAIPARLGPSEAFAREGFIFVYQDVRGRYQSTGTWLEMTPHRAVKGGPADVDESSDAYDTIEWLLANVPGNNGRVGMWGISYPGFYVTASSIDAHPALVAISPQAPVTDLTDGDDAFHGGAFMLAANSWFYSSFRPHRQPILPDSEARPAPPPAAADGYQWFLGDGQLQASPSTALGANEHWMAFFTHPIADEFWRARAIQRHITRGIQFPPASLTVGGWYDAEDPNGPLLTYRAITGLFDQRTARDANGTTHHLVIGPWSHGQFARNDGRTLGPLNFGNATSLFYRDSIEFPFFMQHLKDAPPASIPAVTLYDTGLDTWRRFSAWPLETAVMQPWYLRPSFSLDTIPPSATGGADRYTSDPARPVPYVQRIVRGMAADYIADDQRFAARRPDVLAFASAPLASDVTIGGGVRVTLHVATTGTDADFVVKLIDVYPDSVGGDTVAFRMSGYQRMVRGEPFRARYRRGVERAVPFVPDAADSLTYTLPDVLHTFRRGHRIMVQVQSSWFPLVDRNPQTFVPNIFLAKPGDFRRADMTVFHSSLRASRVDLPVLR